MLERYRTNQLISLSMFPVIYVTEYDCIADFENKLFSNFQFADKFTSEHEELHVLINNAGCMVNKRELTEEGIEKNFATNTLGTHILTKKLIPLLQKVRTSRLLFKVAVINDFISSAILRQGL